MPSSQVSSSGPAIYRYRARKSSLHISYITSRNLLCLRFECLSEESIAPCGIYCGSCTFLNKKDQPTCSGCGSQKGHPFWGECKVYACAAGKVEHCGVCENFPCDLFVNQFDPLGGQKSAFTRAGLLAYRKKVGTQKFIEMCKKLDEKHP
jgi:hypothetical protein